MSSDLAGKPDAKGDIQHLRYKVEHAQGWHEAVEAMPWFTLPFGWKISVIPPFGDAVIRFQVKSSNGKKQKSVYLDARNSLGCWTDKDGKPTPYWEVYPVDGDIRRCAYADLDTLKKLLKARN